MWMDLNGNGIQDGEPGIGGVQVTLTGTTGDGQSVTLNTTTAPDGSYLFDNLEPGDYVVTFIAPPGLVPLHLQTRGVNDALDSDADEITGQTTTITLVSGEVNHTIDAAYYPPVDLEVEKTFVSAVLQPDGTYNVTYTIDVINTGSPASMIL
ncbi:MAG: hypothetical protein IPN33_17325 [Saprospiraceae bacterium]|nr:hypothetical protein [Saprospiraceae bacterium]